MLSECEITPVLVFDGRPLPAKQDENEVKLIGYLSNFKLFEHPVPIPCVEKVLISDQNLTLTSTLHVSFVALCMLTGRRIRKEISGGKFFKKSFFPILFATGLGRNE